MQSIERPRNDNQVCTAESDIRAARDLAWHLMRAPGWQRRDPELAEKYLVLRYATDRRPLYGALYFDREGAATDLEVLSLQGEWNAANLVRSAAIHDATSVMIFAVRNGDQAKMDNLAGSDKRRIKVAKDFLDVMSIQLQGWITISGTLALKVNCR